MLIDGNQTSATIHQKKIPEKRRTERFPVDVSVIFTRFTTRNEVKFRSKTFDCSMEGMAFDSKCLLKKGDSLFIRTEYPPYPGAKSRFFRSRGMKCLRTTTLAEVKWYREMAGDSEYNYRVGVKYL